MKGLAFKILPPKDITKVLGILGLHPPVTPEAIEAATSETATNSYQCLSEFCYDMDIQQVRARMCEGGLEHGDVFDEAIHLLTIFKLTKQLAWINQVEDFSLKDLWEPNAKRCRAILSGLINFSRYKEARVVVIESLQQEEQALDGSRLEQIEKLDQTEQELVAAQEKHNQELHDMWVAENTTKEARGVVDKLQRQRQTADRVRQDTDARLESIKERALQHEQRLQLASKCVSELRDQVAESPEGLEQEIGELELAVRQHKAHLTEKADEKRTTVLHNHVLHKIMSNVDNYKEELNTVREVVARSEAARLRTQQAREGLATLRRQLEARRAEEAELGQAVRQLGAAQERAKQLHDERAQQNELRRQHALQQQQELQAKRTEEQKQHYALQTQRMELEAEVASVRRAHEAEMHDLREQLQALRDSAETYDRNLETLLAQHKAGGKNAGPDGSPDGARRRISGSPSPLRSARRPRPSASPAD